LKSHDKELLTKEALVLMNKIDAIPEEDREKLKKGFLKKFPKLKSKFRMISAASGENLKELIFELWNAVQAHREKLPEPKDDEIIEYIPKALVDENSFEVKKLHEVHLENFHEDVLSMLIGMDILPKRTVFEVKGKRIQQISRMTNRMWRCDKMSMTLWIKIRFIML
jgi:GTPase Era involved in 16S rRNA processing